MARILFLKPTTRMDPLVQQLIRDVACLQAQVEWLTWLVRMSLVLSGISGLFGAANLALTARNNKREK